jgi:HEAT repeat protein
VPIYLGFVARAGTAADALAAAKYAPSEVVPVLLEQLDSPSVTTRLAAARALGAIDGPQTTAALAKLVQSGSNRREALAALMLSGGDDARRFVAEAETDAPLAAAMRSVRSQIRTFIGEAL